LHDQGLIDVDLVARPSGPDWFSEHQLVWNVAWKAKHVVDGMQLGLLYTVKGAHGVPIEKIIRVLISIIDMVHASG